MLDSHRHSSIQFEISGTILIIPRGEFTHKTYHFSSLVTGKTFNEIIKILKQVEVGINEIIRRDPDIKEGL